MTITEKYKPYPKYKDSGVEWIGEIPINWRIIPLRWFLDIKSGEFLSNDEFLKDKHESMYPVIGGNGLLGYTEKFNSSEPTIVIGRVGALCGNIHLIKEKAWITDNALVLTYVREFNLNYLMLLLKVRNLNLLQNQNTQPLITGNTVKSQYGLLPPRSDQSKIVMFLDKETSRIDYLIEKKNRQIELLKEKRSALINHAVTKGLNPNAKMKDSGVEWIGEIPEGWGTKKLKYAAKLVTVKMENQNSNVAYIGLENIESWTGRLIGTQNQDEFDGQANTFNSGDVLFCKLRPYLAKVHKAFENGICTSELLVFRPIDIIQSYLFYYFLNSKFIEVVNSSTYGTKMPRANWDFISSLLATVPTYEEQVSIAKYLDKEINIIDTLIDKIQISIEKLKEYRVALISAAVTGKIDVGGWKEGNA